jgi:hypothetical protein
MKYVMLTLAVLGLPRLSSLTRPTRLFAPVVSLGPVAPERMEPSSCGGPWSSHRSSGRLSLRQLVLG